MSEIEQLLQTMRDVMPRRWGLQLSRDTLIKMALDLEFLQPSANAERVKLTELGRLFGVRRMIPRDG